MDKKTTNIIIALLAVSVLMNGIFIAKIRDLNKTSQQEPAIVGILNEELSRSKGERDWFKIKADSFEGIALQKETQIALLARKMKQTNGKFIKDIAAWRALPDDKRVEFFATELAKVDSIPGW